MKQQSGFEIERKFLISMPSQSFLKTKSSRRLKITQTYLCSGAEESARVRSIVENGISSYVHTVKKKISMIKRLETEREIDAQEYETLLKQKDPSRRTIQKIRHCVPYEGHLLEIDIFPFWIDKAFMEIELGSEDEIFALPPEIHVLKEVTEDKRYTNAALAKELPE